jgi:hypothetical protein
MPFEAAFTLEGLSKTFWFGSLPKNAALGIRRL